MTPSERYRQVAALHAANINQGFLTTLGGPFLALMYRAVDEAHGSVLIVHEAAGEVRGFVSGTRGMGAIYRRMLRHPFRLTIALLPSLILPLRLKRIFEIMRYSGGATGTPGLPEAELLSIAVDRAWRGQGIAESLYSRLTSSFAADGVAKFRIVVGAALAPAHRFYLRMGARSVARIEVHAGEASIVYVQDTGESTA